MFPFFPWNRSPSLIFQKFIIISQVLIYIKMSNKYLGGTFKKRSLNLSLYFIYLCYMFKNYPFQIHNECDIFNLLFWDYFYYYCTKLYVYFDTIGQFIILFSINNPVLYLHEFLRDYVLQVCLGVLSSQHSSKVHWYWTSDIVMHPVLLITFSFNIKEHGWTVNVTTWSILMKFLQFLLEFMYSLSALITT